MDLIKIIKEEFTKILGKGEGGTAYLTDDNKVYKITESIVEYLIAKKLLNKDTKSLYKVFDLGKTEDGKYYIIREYFHDIPSNIKEILKNPKTEKLILDYYSNNDFTIQKYLGNKFIEFLDNLKEELPLIKLDYTKLDLESLYRNIGLDDNGNYRLFDF